MYNMLHVHGYEISRDVLTDRGGSLLTLHGMSSIAKLTVQEETVVPLTGRPGAPVVDRVEH